MQQSSSFSQQPMEWYSSPGGPGGYNSGGTSGYQYAPPPAAHASAAAGAYASFEEEPPLLEGVCAQCVCGCGDAPGTQLPGTLRLHARGLAHPPAIGRL
jgi:hypothetical protein